MNVHPESFRALAYEVRAHLTASGYTDDTKIGLPLIEAQLRHDAGAALKKRDLDNIRLGAEPESWRLKRFVLPLAGVDMWRTAELPAMILFNGMPYLTFLGTEDEKTGQQVGFTPTKSKWQLTGMVRLCNKPAYTVSDTSVTVQVTPKTILVSEVVAYGIPMNPFPSEARGDDWYWAQAWGVPEELKKEIKLNTISVFMNTHVQLAGRRDIKNNGLDG